MKQKINTMSTLLSDTIQKSTKTDRFEAPDYYNVDELLTDEHILVRTAVRDWVKKEVTPIIEAYSEQSKCPLHLYKEMGELGALGPSCQKNMAVAAWMKLPMVSSCKSWKEGIAAYGLWLRCKGLW